MTGVTDPSTLEPARIGRYQLLARIGEGGMGVVYLGRDPEGNRRALKVLRPHVVGDDEGRERLAREVSTLRRVRSPRVAEVYDADPWGDQPYVVTRYVPGRSLHRQVREEGPLDDHDLRLLALGLAEAMVAVHSAGVVHRDIKPSNVLMEGRAPVLIDFGLAKLADDSRLTMTGWLMGTPGYLAPEVLYGDEPSPASDVHSWAATVVFAATGASPYGKGPSMAVLDRARRGEFDVSALPTDLQPLVARALTGDPGARPAAEELAARLAQLQVAPGERADTWPAEAAPLTAQLPVTGPLYQLPRDHEQPRPEPAPPDPVRQAALDPGPVAPEPVAPERPAEQTVQQQPVDPPPHYRPPQPLQSAPAVQATRQLTVPVDRYAGPPGDEAGGERRVDRLTAFIRGAFLGTVGAVTAATIGLAPYIGLALLFVAGWLLRTVSLNAEAHADRQERKGVRRSDSLVRTISWPWHLFVTLWGSLALVLLVASVVAAVTAGGLLLGQGLENPLLLGAVLGLLAGWWGPGSRRLRGRARRITRRIVAPDRTSAILLILLVMLAALLVLVRYGSGVLWYPDSMAPYEHSGSVTSFLTG